MTFSLIFQVILNGLIKGLVYALTAAGFSLIYGQAKILFFALGEIYMLGAVLCYLLIAVWGLPYFLAIGLAFLVLGLFGIGLERCLFRPLQRTNDLIVAFASIVLGMLLAGIVMETFGVRGKAIPNPFHGMLHVLGAVITIDKIVVVSVSLVILLGLHFFFKYTRWGQAIRAVAQDEDSAQLVGVNIQRIKALTFFLALGVAGTAGGLVAPLSFVDFSMGSPVLMTTLIVVVLGGLGSFPGAIIGGICMGLIESFGYTFLGGISTIVSFAFVIAVLIFRPQGLLGHA